MKILICDDEMIFLNEIQKKVKDYFEKRKIDVLLKIYNNGEDLLKLCKNEVVDVILLDIDMPRIDGFQVAKNVRELYPKCIIVFCSSHNELVYDSFEYEPFWFLCKNNYEGKLEIVLGKIIERIQQYNKEFVVKIKGQLIRIKYQNILYVEVNKHKIKIHLKEEILEYRGNLSDVEKQFLENNFIKINSGCLANFEWIFKIQNNELQLKNGELLVISRSNKKNVKNMFFNYLERK